MRRRKRPDWLILIALIAFGIALDRWQVIARGAGRTDPVSSTVRTVLSPAVFVMNSASQGVSDFVDAIGHGRELERENARLRALTAVSETYASDIDRMQGEIDELRRLGGWQKRMGREKVPADVIGLLPGDSRITINVGSNRGIKRGMPVATFEGLVGRIETVDRETAQVLLITSTSSDATLSALILRQPPNPPSAGLIRGDGPGSLRLELPDPAAAVDAGDLVVTSGFSEVIPRGIAIGKVVSVQDDPVFGKRTAILYPRVALGQVREVLVIK